MVVFPSQSILFTPSIKVDLIDLPQKITSPTKTEIKSEPPKITITETKKNDTKPKIDTKNKQAEALKRLQAIEKIKNLSKKNEPPLKQNEQIKGLALSPGSALTGINKIQHDNYLNEIDNHVKKHWLLPEWLNEQGLKAHVQIKIDKRGYVIEKKLVQTSGNNTFDEHVFKAINDANPFPPPTEKFINILAINGLVLRFPE